MLLLSSTAALPLSLQRLCRSYTRQRRSRTFLVGACAAQFDSVLRQLCEPLCGPTPEVPVKLHHCHVALIATPFALALTQAPAREPEQVPQLCGAAVCLAVKLRFANTLADKRKCICSWSCWQTKAEGTPSTNTAKCGNYKVLHTCRLRPATTMRRPLAATHTDHGGGVAPVERRQDAIGIGCTASLNTEIHVGSCGSLKRLKC